MKPKKNNAAKKPLRCLVTGGLGYAGAWISAHLAAAGHDVCILSRGDHKADIGQPYTLVQADLEKRSPAELCFLLPDAIDCVVHAASFNETFDPDYARKALRVNCLGTSNLLSALVLQSQRLAQPLPLCVYLSTFHVYGRSEGHITESDAPAPLNDYALTHLFAEEYFHMFERRHDLKTVILRLSNGYGAPRTPDSDKWYLLINDLCKSAVIRGEVPLRSAPSLTRDFVWLGDVARVVELLLGRKDLGGRIFNVSSGNAMTIGEVARIVALAASHQLKKLVQVVQGYSEEDTPLFKEKDYTPSSLRVSNKAVCSALGITFQNRMQEEISALIDLALRTQTGAVMAARAVSPLPENRDGE